ncbi:MAG: 4-(cytidine 5'-diphospho)-2-C-methyl-D-erythritol kinase [Oscillospiraceae bacterium]|jgi:4-diphosphocytidyl-2-C-methyl-D-erythritol kinase|nr:4-(cytidine 5'-diphospho)-2-C-methyl-D-erythritol kinase [Oscillospiraceae bacterium]
MKIIANAKINLTLEVTGRLPSGFHSIASLMQSVSLADIVTVEQTPQAGIAITCSQPDIPTDERNIVHKAIRAFEEAFAPLPTGIAVHIEKRIPSEAGLGGGSADAAAVLTALRAIFEPNCADAQLGRIGARVGADVPFCLRGGLCMCEGIGDILSPLPPMPACYPLVIAKPPCGISTKEAYQAIDTLPPRSLPRTSQLGTLITSQEWEKLFARCANVFELAAPFPIFDSLRAAMRAHGAMLAQMSGSGSAIFGIFKDENAAALCADTLREMVDAVFLCRAIQKTSQPA